MGLGLRFGLDLVLEASSALRLCSKSATGEGSSSCSPEPIMSSSATCCCWRTGRAAIIEALYTVRTWLGLGLGLGWGEGEGEGEG